MPFVTQGPEGEQAPYGVNKTNWKYILIVVILAVIVGGGILGYRYWWAPKKEAEVKSLNEILDRVKNIHSIKYQLTILADGKLISKQNIWRKGENDKTKVRIETEPLAEGGETITLWDSSESLLYMYSPKSNIARGGKIDYKPHLEGTEESFSETSEIIKNTKPIIIGKETIDEKECLIVKNSNERGYWIKNWVWMKYGLPIRMITPLETIGGKIDTSRENEVRRKNIEVNIDIPDDLFQLPAGTQIVPIKEGIKPEEPYIKVLSPNGGEEWIEGNIYDITWESSGVEKVAIEVAVGGKDKGHITFGVDANLGKYSWKIPAGFISGFGISRTDSARIRIYNTTNDSVYDENDNYFSIVAKQ